MRKYIVMFLTLFMVGCGNETASIIDQGKDPDQIGTVRIMGIDFSFDFTDHEIVLYNRNDTNVNGEIYNISRDVVLDKDWLTMAGNKNSAQNAVFEITDLVEFKFWRGSWDFLTTAIWDTPPDVLVQVLLKPGVMATFFNPDLDSYEIELPEVKGVSCKIQGKLIEGNTVNQTNTYLMCTNGSSDTVRVELYVLRRDGFDYVPDFEQNSFWISAQVGERYESQRIYRFLKPGEDYALRVSAYDPYDAPGPDTFIQSHYKSFWIDLDAETAYELNLDVPLLETQSPDTGGQE